MGNLFGEPVKEEPSKEEVILELKHQRDDLLKYENKLNLQIKKETAQAKLHLKNNKKELAVLSLKKKKLQEDLLKKASGTRFNLETMVTSE